MKKILCCKNWLLDGKLLFTEGKYYKIKEIVKMVGRIQSVRIESDSPGYTVWFHTDSEYFHIPPLGRLIK